MAEQKRTIQSLAAMLRSGDASCVALVEEALTQIALEPSAFTYVAAKRARVSAEESHQFLQAGKPRSLLEGVPISVKDLFDCAGEVTTAGSQVLRQTPAATQDAPVIAALRAAGAVLMGRTHMSEFAFTGLGDNPHFPRCANPTDGRRVPGGSSSGAAVSVARGQAMAGIGTDTGGSVRIPAAFCGLVGFKPTQRRVSRDGAFALSVSQDSVGPIAHSVECCAIVDEILTNGTREALVPVALDQLRLAVPQDYVLEGLDPHVAATFDESVERLRRVGAKVDRVRFSHFRDLPEIFSRGTIVNAEAFQHHRDLGLLAQRSLYDPMVLARIDIGGRMGEGDVARLLEVRAQMMRETNSISSSYDALLMPTTANVAPLYQDIATPESFGRQNALALRNTSLFNFLDRCAISLPMPVAGGNLVGLMLVGETMGDRRLLCVAKAVEGVLGGG